MDSSNAIRFAISKVFALRTEAREDPVLNQAVRTVKRIQSSRLHATYGDLLSSEDFGTASRFFLDDLYGVSDYSDRDAQFARVAGGMSNLLSASVVETAVTLAQLHALTEELDHQMATGLAKAAPRTPEQEAAAYVVTWLALGRRPDRQRQLEGVMEIGNQLVALTRKPGLTTLLKLMRRPAEAAGLSSLQHFLETGFGIFKALAHTNSGVTKFLQTIEQRESAWLQAMFDNAPGKQTKTLIQQMSRTA
jgi:hypothetical protein